jgi:hypothetical protein
VLHNLPVILFQGQIEGLSCVVTQDMRVNWILHEVIESAARIFIQLHQVLVVANSTLLPQVGCVFNRLTLDDILLLLVCHYQLINLVSLLFDFKMIAVNLVFLCIFRKIVLLVYRQKPIELCDRTQETIRCLHF